MKIGLLLYENCMPSGLLYFVDMVGTVNTRLNEEKFKVVWVALEPGVITCAHGIPMNASHALADTELDALLIPGFWGVGELEELLAQQASLVEHLKAVPQSVRFWSYCAGVALHAASNRLKDQRATITWWMADYAKQYLSHVKWHNNYACIYADYGATSSGANGSVQIFQHLIQDELGESVSREVSKFMVLPRPYLEYLPYRDVDLIYLDDPMMKKIFYWADKQEARDLTVVKLAEYLNLTERTLARKVNDAVGTSVLKFLEQMKINQAAEQLVFTNQTINKISDDLGYTDDSNFRRTFKRLTGMTPKTYRDKYRDKDELAEVQRDLLY